MVGSRVSHTHDAKNTAQPFRLRSAGVAVATVLAMAVQAQAQTETKPEASVVVVGEGSVSLAPDFAHIRGGVTTRANTISEAIDANSKAMVAVTAALLDNGIAQKDIQTSRFSVQPVYAAQQPGTEPKQVGYSVPNQVGVTIRQIDRIGQILDRLAAAGATDVGNIEFLVSEPSKALDQARAAAIADARCKAEVYTRAAGVQLGRILWITEVSGNAAPVPLRAQSATAMALPIATGEDTMQVRVTVGFDIAR